MTDKKEISLRGFRYHAGLAEETPAFTASLYIDGNRKGTVSNQGSGGPHVFSQRAAELEVDEYAKTLPPLKANDRELPMDGDLLISCLVSDILIQRDRKNIIRRTVRKLRSKAQPFELIVVGVKREGYKLMAIGDVAERNQLATVVQKLREEEGINDGFAVYNTAGNCLEIIHEKT